MISRMSLSYSKVRVSVVSIVATSTAISICPSRL